VNARAAALAVTLLLADAGASVQQAARELRVCADPNNLPFSNRREEGFENRLAALVAREMGAELRYTWWPQRRAFLRQTLDAGRCDVVMGVPSSWERVLATRPYYRSTYVFVTRRADGRRIASLDDRALRRLRVGVHLMGDDGANAPPAHALAARGIVDNVRGFPIYGDYGQENPPARILGALAGGEIDVAIVWGPLAGYFAGRQRVPLALAPVTPQIDLPFLPFVYDMSMGVRRDNPALAGELDAVVVRRRAEIQALLRAYGVPEVTRARGSRSQPNTSQSAASR
jgi:mxaJ protein